MKTLDELLHAQWALPIVVKPDGETAAYPLVALTDYAPESIEVGWSGEWDMPNVLEKHEQAAIDGMMGGWEIVTGWAGAGTLFIFDAGRTRLGADLEQHMRETPGLYSIVPVEMQPPICENGEDGMPCREFHDRERCEHCDIPRESKAAGWALIRRVLSTKETGE